MLWAGACRSQVLRNACAIFLLYLVLFLAGGMLICCMDEIPLMQALFEAASAIGTVGLSLGATAEASEAVSADFDFFDVFWTGGRPDHDLRHGGRLQRRLLPVSPGTGDGGMRTCPE